MATGPSAAKAEMFLIVVAALCLVGAAATLMVQHTAPASTPSIKDTTATAESDEPASVPLPAGPRKFQ